MREKVLSRFLNYVSIDTCSDPNSDLTPSTQKQFDLAKILVKELEEIGLEDISLDDNCYLMAKLPANVEGIGAIGFISHMDTAPDMTGANVKPRIIENYNGEDIVLNAEKDIVTKIKDYPELARFKGQSLIVTDGNTLLGADDKAGIAEIITAVEYLAKHPEIKHGDIMVGFTPDEEIGRGADLFDVKKFGAKYAYTMDGGEMGELEYETFNAAAGTVTIQGRNVHPGSAKDKMINSQYIAADVMSALPIAERPESTEGYEGFYHLTDINGNTEQTVLKYIIRDHNREKFEERKLFFQKSIEEVSKKYNGRVSVEIKDQYYNMREVVEQNMFMVDIAVDAMKDIGIEPNVIPIRGGTDGSKLSFMGLPCPNLFAGGVYFHGRNEFIAIEALEAASKLIVRIAEKYAENKIK
ncbi:peptidase T [Peptostreptococcus equinus]|uniref:Peptidase T n=1 Tax=Peptostreptococcus equinus TaxID=3003601 RepID=A0ABY7JPD5_9FIRM|nr:peptidase T [Peptostreptococcus sp. CBA3647]WAW14960.1 peptidase T [Peptostreptococcus sp. CBA3647]